MKRSLITVGFVGLLWAGASSAAALRGDTVFGAMARPCTTIVTTITQGTTTIVSTVTQTIHDTTTVTVTYGTTTAPPPPTCSSEPYCGDYETGDFSQWTWTAQGNAQHSIVTSPVAQGTYAAKFQVFSAPNGDTSTVNRAEVFLPESQAGGTPGQDWWYGWYTMFPSGQSFWPNSHDFNDFTQMNENGGARYDYFGVDATHDFVPTTALYANTSTGHHTLVPDLAFDHWYHFVVHMRWATDATGYFTVFIDGMQVLNDQNTATLPASNPHGVISQGFYTNRNMDNTVYHDGFCRAATFAAAAAC